MYIQAGGGVVADSIAEDEYRENPGHKSGALLRAIDWRKDWNNHIKFKVR
ncbi:MAG: hypothetical protein Ct9H300mP27_10060 [Chloroflexota bacterium]|nr:MAG: hypothetical protein Ct9H300mP27_10060 [Chloroflexota bacterium]